MAIRNFIAWRKQAGLAPRISATFNILHNDPQMTPAEDYRIDICAATDRPVGGNGNGISEGLIPEGRCAVIRISGSSDKARLSAASSVRPARGLSESKGVARSVMPAL